VREFDRLLAGRWAAIAGAAQERVAGEARRLRTCARHVALGTRSGLAASGLVLANRGARVARCAEAALDRSSRHLERATGRLGTGARVHLRTHALQLEGLRGQLVHRVPRVIENTEKELSGLQAQLRALDPVRTLARGWSITRDASGAVIRSADDVSVGDHLVTTLADGSITSTVTGQPSTDHAPEQEP
jgi:exodeoxyribonuclease VII large subunit